MASIFLETKEKRYTVPCHSLVELVKRHFESEKDKSKWSYNEFCKLISKIPHKELLEFYHLEKHLEEKIQLKTNVEEDVEELSPPTPFAFNDDGTIKNVSSLNIPAVTKALNKFHNKPYNFATLTHAREQLKKLELERADNIKKAADNSDKSKNIFFDSHTSFHIEKSPINPEDPKSFKMPNENQLIQPLKWDLPKFSGIGDPEEYINKIEIIGKVGQWKDENKMNAFILGLTSNASFWYRNNEEETLKDKNWEQVKEIFLKNFKQMSALDDDFFIFCNRRQLHSETPLDYIENKIFLANKINPKLSDAQLIEKITFGLLPFVAQQVFCLKSKTLEELKTNVSTIYKSFALSGNPIGQGSPVSIQKEEKKESKMDKVEQMMAQLLKTKEEEEKEDPQLKKVQEMMAQLMSNQNNQFKGNNFQQNQSNGYYRGNGRGNFRGKSRGYYNNNYSNNNYSNNRGGYKGGNNYRGNNKRGNFRGKFQNKYQGENRSRSPYKDTSNSNENPGTSSSFHGRPNSKDRNQKGIVKCMFCLKFGHHESTCRNKKAYLELQLKKMENL